jgi:secretion/DNA translocation related TadE-like protein
VGERGSATVLALALVLVIIGVGLAVVAATQLVTARTRAVLAADAAALAAAPMTFPPIADQTPEQAAGEFAGANGARLLRCVCPIIDSFDPRAVEVEVRLPTRVVVVGQVELGAVGRAEFIP